MLYSIANPFTCTIYGATHGIVLYVPFYELFSFLYLMLLTWILLHIFNSLSQYFFTKVNNFSQSRVINLYVCISVFRRGVCGEVHEREDSVLCEVQP